VRPEGLGKLRTFIQHIASRTRNLPACSLSAITSTLPRAIFLSVRRINSIIFRDQTYKIEIPNNDHAFAVKQRNISLCRNYGSHSVGKEEHCLLGYNAVHSEPIDKILTCFHADMLNALLDPDVGEVSVNSCG
jgi:hypothetical protein